MRWIFFVFRNIICIFYCLKQVFLHAIPGILMNIYAIGIAQTLIKNDVVENPPTEEYK